MEEEVQEVVLAEVMVLATVSRIQANQEAIIRATTLKLEAPEVIVGALSEGGEEEGIDDCIIVLLEVGKLYIIDDIRDWAMIL